MLQELADVATEAAQGLAGRALHEHDNVIVGYELFDKVPNLILGDGRGEQPAYH
jgi:hypothetical protein